MYMKYSTVSVAILNNVLISHFKSSFENILVLVCVFKCVCACMCVVKPLLTLKIIQLFITY